MVHCQIFFTIKKDEEEKKDLITNNLKMQRRIKNTDSLKPKSKILFDLEIVLIKIAKENERLEWCKSPNKELT